MVHELQWEEFHAKIVYIFISNPSIFNTLFQPYLLYVM